MSDFSIALIGVAGVVVGALIALVPQFLQRNWELQKMLFQRDLDKLSQLESEIREFQKSLTARYESKMGPDQSDLLAIGSFVTESRFPEVNRAMEALQKGAAWAGLHYSEMNEEDRKTMYHALLNTSAKVVNTYADALIKEAFALRWGFARLGRYLQKLPEVSTDPLTILAEIMRRLR